MKGRTSMRRRIGVIAAALTATLAAVAVSATPASAFTPPPQAYGGFGSGAETFADLGGTLPGSLAEATVAFANSVVNSRGLQPVTDELGRLLTPNDPAHASKAMGAALELKVLGSEIQLVADAVAVAPPSMSASDSLLELPVSTLAFAEALEGRAVANFNDAGADCILGADLANGRGEAANVQLVGDGPAGDTGFQNPLISLSAGDADVRDVVSTASRQRLVAQTRRDGSLAGNKVGVLSQVEQTVAPVTIADPTGAVAISIEVAGKFQLSAFAGGVPGTGYVTYNPDTGGAMPVISITFPPSGPLGGVLAPILGVLPADVASLVNFDPATGQLLVPLGPALELLQPLVDLLAQQGIVIGERPRAIGSTAAPTEAADGTTASAAIDLVRIQPIGLLSVLSAVITDVRIGHMEVQAFAPAGGIDCPGIGVNKTTDRDPVQVGESFVLTISAFNPCFVPLTNVRVQDDITATNGIGFSVGTTNPAADANTPIPGGTRVVFNDIGPIPPRGTKVVQIQATVNSATGNGRISDTVTVTGTCGIGGGNGDVNVNLNLRGSFTLNAPGVGAGGGGGGELLAPVVTTACTSASACPSHWLSPVSRPCAAAAATRPKHHPNSEQRQRARPRGAGSSAPGTVTCRPSCGRLASPPEPAVCSEPAARSVMPCSAAPAGRWGCHHHAGRSSW